MPRALISALVLVIGLRPGFEVSSGGALQTQLLQPTLKRTTSARPSLDAAGRSQLFERVEVAGLTTVQEGMNGVAIADLNHDGLLDILATYSAPSSGPRARPGTRLRLFLNERAFRFREHSITIHGSSLTASEFGPRAQVPVLADFNRDGFLDVFVTRSVPMVSGQILPRSRRLGNTFLLSAGRWDVFKDISSAMGTSNDLAYNRQPALGDVNRDGWIDIAVGSDNIGDAQGGLPHSRLYIFQPRGPTFEHGTFRDIGGTDVIPDFGGFYHDSNRDKAGPDINLRDLDNDGDLDLLQSYHADCRAPRLPYSPGEYRQGVFVWKNMLAETGRFRFVPSNDNGLAEVGKLRYDTAKQIYQPVLVGSGLPYISLADVNNDTLLDIIAVGPSDPGWSPRAEYVGGRFWYNSGSFKFRRATDTAGLDPLNWTYREWYRFFGIPVGPRLRDWTPQRRSTIAQPGLPPNNPLDNRPYYADAIFGDFDNDGWTDVVVLDRRELTDIDSRTVLFMNRGDGTFQPTTTKFSGLETSGISGEAADLNNDGLLDLVFAADPENSGTPASLDRYESSIYWNTGQHGARRNHWLRIRFNSLGDASIIGARIEARDAATGKLVTSRVVAAEQGYKSGSPVEAHLGLGKHERVTLEVFPVNGKKMVFPGLSTDKFLELDLIRGKTVAL